jgi:hypothetical protein
MDTLEKLCPNQDLQCYFFEPSAIAALSSTSPTGFTVSGTWRQQFDWAVVEWNRDDVFEHPAFRPLPDGDLSGLTLSYQETRSNCIPMDSNLYPTVDWPTLRIWANNGTGEQVYKIPLMSNATPIAGQYNAATAEITLGGATTPNDYVGFAFLEEHYSYRMGQNDTLVYASQQLVDAVQAFSPTMSASLAGATITLTYSRPNSTSSTGANGNRVGLYTYVSGAGTEQWDCAWRQFSGGTSPTAWQIVLPFGSLSDPALGSVPATSIRKLRWTYSADLQSGAFQRSEFQVVVSNWTVTGSGRSYSVAATGSQRIEDDAAQVSYTGAWSSSSGNFSGGSIHLASTPGSAIACAYTASAPHNLYLGTRYVTNGAAVTCVVDSAPSITLNLQIPGEDVLARIQLAELAAGNHTVTVSYQGNSGASFYFDFFEIAIPTTALPQVTEESRLALATDWDTEHSSALAPERTAWLIQILGFQGRVNHYVGALWFYELVCSGQQYASATITFSGTPDPDLTTTISIGTTSDPSVQPTAISHLNLIGDTAATLATAFELQIDNGYTGIWAAATGNQLTIYAREMGVAGNTITVGVSSPSTDLSVSVSGATLSGGVDGSWLTDLQASPPINRAARDWHQSFFGALLGYGMNVTASFSMELGNGDPSAGAGIAQRYPSQAAVIVSTPALQTNFSPTSVSFWKQVYAGMAGIQLAAGLVPYLQFGEVQWWYFPDDGSGMPFYDAYTTSSFSARYGRAMQVVTSNTIDPTTVPEEAAFLPTLIGAFTDQISSFVLQSYPTCRFEVLYPVDVNASPLNVVINYPQASWTPQKLSCLKTESFTYTSNRNLEQCKQSIGIGAAYGFSPSHGSHLVGISDPSSPWLKEARIAEANGLESVVLFALDQFCLIGYGIPLSRGARRSVLMG